MLALDHVILGSNDPEASAERLRRDHGLGSLPGGRHAGRGTANRIVPLGSDYLEILGIADEEEARGDAFGRWVLEGTAGGERLLGWCLRTPDIDEVASRLGLEVTSWSRTRPDGRSLRWRLAGLPEAMIEPSLPFFIQWGIPADLHPGREPAEHEAETAGIAWVEVAGSPDRTRRWLGDAELPARVEEGAPAIRAVGIALDDREVEIRP